MIRVDSIDSVLKLVSDLKKDNITVKIIAHDEEYWYNTPKTIDRWRFRMVILSSIGQFYFLKSFMLTDTKEIENLKSKVKDLDYMNFPLEYCNNELVIN